MLPWDHVGVPLHFHSSTISGSTWRTIARTFASIFPRQSPSSLILSSINAEADSTGLRFFIYTSNWWQLFGCEGRRSRRRIVGWDAAPVSQRLTAQQATEPQERVAQFFHTSRRLTAQRAAEPRE